MRTIEIDCLGVETEAAFWQLYVDAVRPAGAELFGRNLDAFWDAIESDGPGSPGPAIFVFTGSAALATLQRPDGSFLDALRRIATDATRVRIDFA